jgi:hypothetical protein
MTTLKILTIVAALLAGGTSLAIAQNGPATGGQSPVAGALMAAVGVVAGMLVVPTAMATGPTDTCMPTIRITATTGIGITKQIAAELII